MRIDRLAASAALILLLPLVAACSTSGATGTTGSAGTPGGTSQVAGARATPQSNGSKPAVKIGSKNFTEQLILGEMYAQLLQANGIAVDRKLNLGGTIVAQQALTGGQIDMYPEYTGTGLLVVLKAPSQSDPQAVYDTVSREYKQQFNLVWLDQAPMNNTQALAMKKETAQANGINTISDLVKQASQLTIAAPPDFAQREDGLLGLKKSYGDFNFKEVKVVDPGIKYQALLNNQADVVLAFGTDGQIDGYNLQVLQDDKALWPPYHVAPVVRQDTLSAYPDLPGILNKLAPLLTDETMRNLNWRVDGPDKQDPAAVATDFLKSKGLIQ